MDEKGLIIHHCGYFHTTKDKIRTIDKLEKNDRYDLILVVMQYNQMLNVLKDLGENISPYIILVGNNMNPKYCQEEILKLSSVNEKQIGFGFQGTGGYRKNERVISMHPLNIGMTIGGLRSRLKDDFEEIIKRAFERTRYKLSFQEHMEGWLLSHGAHILPGCYLCYALDCNLKKARRQDAQMSAVATWEAYRMLKSLGYPICPEGEEEKYSQGIEKKAKKLYFMYKTPIGKFVISNHCKHAVEEMSSLDRSFNDLRKNSHVKMDSWDRLRKNAEKVLLYVDK